MANYNSPINIHFAITCPNETRNLTSASPAQKQLLDNLTQLTEPLIAGVDSECNESTRKMALLLITQKSGQVAIVEFPFKAV